MNFQNTSRILFFFIIVLLAACNKDNIDELTIDDPEFTPEIMQVNNLVTAVETTPNNDLELECITLVFPFDMLLESGETITINDAFDFVNALSQAPPNQVVDFVFPLEVMDSEGNIITINSNQDLGADYAACIPDDGWDTAEADGGLIPACTFGDPLCFDIVYPVDLEDGVNGDTYTAENEAELVDLIATVDFLYFTLPITVVDDNGAETELNSYDDFWILAFQCDGISPLFLPVGGIEISGFGCFELAYPLDIVDENGTVTTINDENEYVSLVLSGDEFEVQFPFSIVNFLGEAMTINDLDDLSAAFLACGVNIEFGETDICDTPAHALLFFNQGSSTCSFNINFPLQLEAEGTIFDLEDDLDYWPVYNAYSLNDINLVYPVSITMNEDGSTVTFENDQEVCDFIDQCF